MGVKEKEIKRLEMLQEELHQMTLREQQILKNVELQQRQLDDKKLKRIEAEVRMKQEKELEFKRSQTIKE